MTRGHCLSLSSLPERRNSFVQLMKQRLADSNANGRLTVTAANGVHTLDNYMSPVGIRVSSPAHRSRGAIPMPQTQHHNSRSSASKSFLFKIVEIEHTVNVRVLLLQAVPPPVMSIPATHVPIKDAITRSLKIFSHRSRKQGSPRI